MDIKGYLRERFKDNEIKLKYKNKIETIYGKSGTNFLANTFSIHRGKFPKSKKRLVLVYLFSIIPSNRCPKLPFMNVENLKDKNLIKRLKENKNIFDQFFSDQQPATPKGTRGKNTANARSYLASKSNAVCKQRTASSKYFSSMMTDILISDVVIN